VLLYGSIESPLSQPRNCFFGHVLSAVIGVCITQLFQLSPQFDNLRWLAGSLSMAVALVVMQCTGTVHPPGGKYMNEWIRKTDYCKHLNHVFLILLYI
jgi:CBS-domain-containing membrane protein